MQMFLFSDIDDSRNWPEMLRAPVPESILECSAGFIAIVPKTRFVDCFELQMDGLFLGRIELVTGGA